MPDQESAVPRPSRALINPELLVWARTTAGLSVEEAAKKIGVKPERLTGWEAGRPPSVPQLRKAANVYKRPLAVFFLPAPPSRPEPLHDFRRLPGDEPPPLSSAALLEMRRARRRRVLALELLMEFDQSAEPFSLHAVVGRVDPEELASRGRDWLGISLSEQQRWRGDYEPLNGWLTAFETHDILVFHTAATSRIPVDEMRGFSIPEQTLPVIVLNGGDSPRGRVFTLMHEFAHLVLSLGGVCEPQRVGRRARTADERVEVFCNRVGGALLVPAGALLLHPAVASTTGRREWREDTLRVLADAFSVSREVILRRLLILGRTTEEFHERKRAEYLRQYRLLAQQRREEDEDGGFAPYYQMVLRSNGRRYTRLVVDALERDRITPGDFSDYLGVRLKHLDSIVGAVERPHREH